MVRQKKKTEVALVRPAVREKKKSLCNSESLPVVQQQTHIRLISWSKPIRDSEGRTPPLIGRGPAIPVGACTFEKCVCCCSQTERKVSRDARSVANLATLSLDLVTFQTPLATYFSKKATSDKSSDFLDKL